MQEISLKAETLFHLGSFPFTNSLLTSFLAVLIILGGGFLLRRKLSIIPNKAQALIELAIEEALTLMDSVLGERRLSEKYLPLIATIFTFILVSNWLGLLPGMGSIILREASHTTPLLRSPSSDLNFTLALAVSAVIAVNLIGVSILGVWSYGKKFFNFDNPITFFVGILELISEFARIISFSFRLFGNVFAGEVLLIIIAFLVPYFIPLPFLFLEIFVGFIQAFVFAMLTLVFIGTAIAAHGEEH